MAKRTQAVVFWGQLMCLPVDPSNDRVFRTFTQGQCHSLARALHEITGWPIVALCWADGGVRESAAHFVVQAPNGDYVDITGAFKPGERWQAWPVTKTVKASTVARKLNGWDRQNIGNARPFAKAVIKQLKKSGDLARIGNLRSAQADAPMPAPPRVALAGVL